MDPTAIFIVELREEICRLVRNSCVLDRLCPHIVHPLDANRIRRVYKTSPRQATNKLLDVLLTTNAPGKWVAFQESLYEAEYPYLAKLIKERKTMNGINNYRKIIELFAPYMQTHINPIDVVPALYAKKVINEIDRDEILTTYNRLGATAATLSLLDHIQCRLHPKHWYEQFMRVLFETGHEDLVNQLEPEFKPGKSLENSRLSVVLEQSASEPIEYKETSADDFKTKLKDLRSEMAEFVKVSNVIHYLVPDLISADKRDILLEDELEYSYEACFQLIGDIMSSNNPCRFIDVLYAADYPYYADILSGKLVYHSRFKVLSHRIQLYRPYICTRLDPLSVVPHLLAGGVINYLDIEEICASNEQYGNTQAVHTLLDCIQCRKCPTIWYTQFLDSLSACGYQDLVDLIEPDYSENPCLWKKKLEEGNDDVDDLNESEINVLTQERKNIIKFIDEALAIFAADEESIVRSEIDIRLEIDKLRQDYKQKERLLLADLHREKAKILRELQTKKELLLDIKRKSLYRNKVISLDESKSAVCENLLRKYDERPIIIEFCRSKLLERMRYLGYIESNANIAKCDSVTTKEQLEHQDNMSV